MGVPKVYVIDVPANSSASLDLVAAGLNSASALFDIICTKPTDDGITPVAAMTFTGMGFEQPQIPLGRFMSTELSGVDTLTFYSNDNNGCRVVVTTFFEMPAPSTASSPPPQFAPAKAPVPAIRVWHSSYTLDWRSKHRIKLED